MPEGHMQGQKMEIAVIFRLSQARPNVPLTSEQKPSNQMRNPSFIIWGGVSTCDGRYDIIKLTP